VSIQALPGDNRARTNGNRSFGKGFYCPPWQLKLLQRVFLFAEAIEPSAIEATVVTRTQTHLSFGAFHIVQGDDPKRANDLNMNSY
jgi:hypothetical protein